MGVSLYYANRILDRVFGAGTTIVISPHYVGLSTTTPNFDGTNFTEPGVGYARTSVTPSTFWSAAGGIITSQAQVDFLAGGSAWGTVTYAGLWDAASGGNLLWFVELEQPEIIQANDDSHFPTGDLRLSFISTAWTNAAIDLIMGDVSDDGSPYVPGSSMQLGLSTTTPNVDGTNFTEPVGASYARSSLANNGSNFPLASNGVKTHAGAYAFAEATGSWGTITHWGIFDGSTLIVFGSITTPTPVVSGDRVTFRPGEIEIALV